MTGHDPPEYPSDIEDYEMSKRKDGQERGKYTLEFKLEAVRLVKGGASSACDRQDIGFADADIWQLGSPQW